MLPLIKEINSINSSTIKLISLLVRERDYSAQEVYYLLIVYSLTYYTRIVINFNY
jgi:hypothetical protein